MLKYGFSDTKGMLYFNGKDVVLLVEQGKKTATVVEVERTITLKHFKL